MAQSTAELLLLPIWENGRPPYWNSTSGFDYDLLIVMGMVFLISVLNVKFSTETIPDI